MLSRIPITSITVENRQRRVLRDIDTLAESLRARGQIQPIVVEVISADTFTFRLIAGERRLTAAKQLGWTHIDAISRADLPPFEAQLIELEENTRRSNLTWQEEALAVAKVKALLQSVDPSIPMEKVSEHCGLSERNCYTKLALAEAILAEPEGAVAKAENQGTAENLLQRSIARSVDAELESMLSAAGAIESEASPEPALGEVLDVVQLLDGELPSPKPAPERQLPVLNTSFLTWAPAYSGPRFNLIHCDFPYGINHQKSEQGNTSGAQATYDDRPEIFFELLDCFCKNQDRFVAESAHMVFWFSMNFYTSTLDALSAAGWRVNPMPLIWFKSDGTGILPDPQRGPRQVYETALLCSRGDRKIVRSVSNVAAFPGRKDESFHLSQKSQEMLNYFLSMLIDSTSTVLDPTCGSGSALRSARNLGAASVLGLEINPEFAASANAFLSE